MLDLLNEEDHLNLTVDEAFEQVVGEKRCQNYGSKPAKRKMRLQAQLEQANQQRDEVAKEVKELEGRLEEQRIQQEEEMRRMRADMEAQSVEMQAKFQADMKAMLQVYLTKISNGQAINVS